MRKLLLASIALFVAATCATLTIPLLLGAGNAHSCASASATIPPASRVVGASIYGGPGDPTSGTTGYRGETLTGTHAFAELSTNWQATSGWDFAALGDLPHGARLKITATYQGHTRSVIATKLDVGAGGPDIDDHPRAIDLWWQTANALGIPGNAGTWSGLIRIQALGATDPDPSTNADTSCTTLTSTALQRKIVTIARAELAKNISEPGNNCVPYNHCDHQPWCASFVSYVWGKAGVQMPFTEASNAIWTWAKQHAQVLPPTARPQPGDAVLYGTGPRDTTTSIHVGIVEQVLPDDRITTIEGNLSNRIKHNGPFLPADAKLAGEPGPVYAFARPSRR
jgi:hypothetical protein